MTVNTFDKSFKDENLTTFIKAKVNDPSAYIARSIAPFVPVKKDSGTIMNLGSQGIRYKDVARAVGSSYKEVEIKVETTDQWNLSDNGLFSTVLMEDVENADLPLDAEMDKAAMVMEMMQVAFEKLVADSITQANGIPGATLSGTNQWSDAASNPVKDVLAGKEAVRLASGKRVTDIMISRDVLEIFKQHATVIDRFKYTSIPDDNFMEGIIKQLFNVQRVHIGESVVDATNDVAGAVESGSNLVDIWTKKVVLFVSKPNPSRYDNMFMQTFAKKDGLIATKINPTDEERNFSKIFSKVGVEEKRDVRFIDKKAGYVLEDVIA